MATPAGLIAQCDAITEGVTPGGWEEIQRNGVITAADARFIASARTLVPAMRDALAQAEADVRTLLRELHLHAECGPTCLVGAIRARYQEAHPPLTEIARMSPEERAEVIQQWPPQEDAGE